MGKRNCPEVCGGYKHLKKERERKWRREIQTISLWAWKKGSSFAGFSALLVYAVLFGISHIYHPGHFLYGSHNLLPVDVLFPHCNCKLPMTGSMLLSLSPCQRTNHRVPVPALLFSSGPNLDLISVSLNVIYRMWPMCTLQSGGKCNDIHYMVLLSKM